jgi:hypothetical protein
LDSDRKVSIEEGVLFAKNNGMDFIEASAKTGHNIEEVFSTIVHKII